MRLGACYVDTKGERCADPFWTITDVTDKSKQAAFKGNRFRIFKNGIHFNFMRGSQHSNYGGMGTFDNLLPSDSEV
jgi:hypothetical protein